ncbi:MAG: DHH family phosphoesterase [Lachnospiraceae bacterium]|nr:DHH family phosphoesterase [Lachnospiraceae bacterium]
MREENIFRKMLQFENIVVQCHDHPDADTIGSAFGVYTFFKEKGKNVRMIYAGDSDYLKGNLRIMVEALHIPLEYVQDLPKCELIVCVDCQYGEGNVTKFQADHVAVIDHHLDAGHEYDFEDIRSHYGSCCTLVYRSLVECGYPVNQNKRLATALYYGLYMDTNGFGELQHPYDFDMRDELNINKVIFRKMKNANFTMKELESVAMALIRYQYNPEQRVAYIHANPGDCNMLGIVSDLLIQVDNVDTCIVYTECDKGYRLSVRSCGQHVTAEDVALFLTEKVGNGGGHTGKAGGFIEAKRLKSSEDFHAIEDYIYTRTKEFFESYEFLDINEMDIPVEGLMKCRKLSTPHLVVNTSEVVKEGTEFYVRHIEGKTNFVADADTYILISKRGYVEPITKEQFLKTYEYSNIEFHLHAEYIPKAVNTRTNESYDIIANGHTCIPNGTARYYVKKLMKNLNLKTIWDRENFQRGKVGDYLLINVDSPKECFIVEKKRFHMNYEMV